MSHHRINFTKVSLKGKRTWMENGKRRQETRTFMQTINPWNTNDDGTPKTREQIMAGLVIERDKWIANQP